MVWSVLVKDESHVVNWGLILTHSGSSGDGQFTVLVGGLVTCVGSEAWKLSVSMVRAHLMVLQLELWRKHSWGQNTARGLGWVEGNDGKRLGVTYRCRR